MKLQQPFVDLLEKYYFRLEVDGWERVPDRTCLVIGVHSGGALTMDAWSLVNAWQKHFDGERVLHGTAHDVLDGRARSRRLFPARSGSSRPTGTSVGTALERGEDVVVWPGGEVDAMRSWWKRDVAVLGGRTGFVKQAIRSGVPILPVATVGGHDTVFVLYEGKWLADALDKVLGLKKTLRGANLPIIAGFPFPIGIEILPAHVPLPAKIRTELLDPIEVDDDPERVEDEEVRAEDLRRGAGRHPGRHGPARREADTADSRSEGLRAAPFAERERSRNPSSGGSRPSAVLTISRG